MVIAKCAVCGKDPDSTMSVPDQGFQIACSPHLRSRTHDNATSFLPQLEGAIAVWNYMQADPWISTVKGVQ